MPTTTIINGEQRDTISVSDRGFMYGDGIFETMLSCQGRLALWAYHYERLANGCRRLNIPVPEETSLLAQIQPRLQPDRHHIIKIVVTRGEGTRGYRCRQPLSPNIVIGIAERRFHSPEYWQNGIAVFCCATQLAKQPALAGLKHLNRLEQVLAAQEWTDDYQEGLMCDQAGNMIEATSHNLFCVQNGQLYTPDLSSAGVAGVMRRYVIELASKLGIPVYIQETKLSTLAAMDEVFVTNSIDGIWPVRQIGDWRFEPGEITRTLQARVTELLPYQ